jgi:hypothetical protein
MLAKNDNVGCRLGRNPFAKLVAMNASTRKI